MSRAVSIAGLTENQESFCLEYAKCGNATAAYRLAYPKSKAKPETINVAASKLLGEHKIRIRIEGIRKSAEAVTDMTIERWAQEVTRLAISDPRKIMHEDGRMKMPHELDSETAAAIASFKFDIDGSIEYKFWSKPQALDMMARHKGAFEKDNQQKSGALEGLPRELLQAMVQRLKALNANH